MNTTTASKENVIPIENRISVTLDDLCQLLSCGKKTARDIAADANAVCYFGKRTLYNVSKIKDFMDVKAI